MAPSRIWTPVAACLAAAARRQFRLGRSEPATPPRAIDYGCEARAALTRHRGRGVGVGGDEET